MELNLCLQRHRHGHLIRHPRFYIANVKHRLRKLPTVEQIDVKTAFTEAWKFSSWIGPSSSHTYRQPEMLWERGGFARFQAPGAPISQLWRALIISAQTSDGTPWPSFSWGFPLPLHLPILRPTAWIFSQRALENWTLLWNLQCQTQQQRKRS